MRNRVLVPYRNIEKVPPYLESLRLAGVDPHAHSVETAANLDGFSGLLLMGGTDVNPVRYGEKAAPETDSPDDQRDDVEFQLTAEAIAKDLPVLAICRGMQLLNVLLGGTLIQHLGSVRHDPDFEDRAKPAHEVEVRPDSLLFRSVRSDRLEVNSRHHQAISKVGQGLRVSGRDSETGTVEAVEHSSQRFVLGVQWHPEDQVVNQAVQRRLFQSFADALLLP
jgi:putative glutamine amidotransferase